MERMAELPLSDSQKGEWERREMGVGGWQPDLNVF